MAPWLDVLLLAAFFVGVHSRVVLQPGVVLDLPEMPFRGGSPYGLMAVVLSVEAGEGSGMEEIVFFDDERFRLSNSSHLVKLEQAFAASVRAHQEADLIIQIDRRVPHGTVMTIVDTARKVGIKRVNVAVRPK
jgi:biopolymer transport protein ExbD